MKRLIFSTVAIFFSWVTLASAAPIDPGYCEHSLRGGGSLAPDNDVRRAWDQIQAAGWNVISSYPVGAWYVWYNSSNGDAQTSNRWRFVFSNFSYWDAKVMCVRWGNNNSTYNDFFVKEWVLR